MDPKKSLKISRKFSLRKIKKITDELLHEGREKFLCDFWGSWAPIEEKLADKSRIGALSVGDGQRYCGLEEYSFERRAQ